MPDTVLNASFLSTETPPDKPLRQELRFPPFNRLETEAQRWFTAFLIVFINIDRNTMCLSTWRSKATHGVWTLCPWCMPNLFCDSEIQWPAPRAARPHSPQGCPRPGEQTQVQIIAVQWDDAVVPLQTRRCWEETKGGPAISLQVPTPLTSFQHRSLASVGGSDRRGVRWEGL